MAGRSPAYSFYPDKWESHTRHLSDTAYRVFHRMLSWMWTHAPDYSSMPAKESFIALALHEQCDRITVALREIQNPDMPLFKIEGERYVSNGLRKCAMHQAKRVHDAKLAAGKRWHHDADAMPAQCGGIATASEGQCIPVPVPVKDRIHVKSTLENVDSAKVNVPVAEIVAEWNANRGGMRECRVITKAIRGYVSARWTEDIEFHDSATRVASIRAAASSRFCLGDNDRGWKGNFGWWSGTRQGEPVWRRFMDMAAQGGGMTDREKIERLERQLEQAIRRQWTQGEIESLRAKLAAAKAGG